MAGCGRFPQPNPAIDPADLSDRSDRGSERDSLKSYAADKYRIPGIDEDEFQKSAPAKDEPDHTEHKWAPKKEHMGMRISVHCEVAVRQPYRKKPIPVPVPVPILRKQTSDSSSESPPVKVKPSTSESETSTSTSGSGTSTQSSTSEASSLTSINSIELKSDKTEPTTMTTSESSSLTSINSNEQRDKPGPTTATTSEASSLTSINNITLEKDETGSIAGPPTPCANMKVIFCQKPEIGKREAWVTLATNDSYALGAVVVGASLKKSQTSRETHCMITTGVSGEMGRSIRSIFDHVSIVDAFDSNDADNLAVLGRPELGITLTKVNCWKLMQYTKCVFLDADTLVLSNCDELFIHEELSAVADIGWPDIFNSGVFVFTPSRETYRGLIECAVTIGSFDGGDQGLLNTYFHDWRDKDPSYRLSFIYNCPAISIYTYASAYKKFGKDVKIVHFLGADKPWLHTYAQTSEKVEYGAGSQPLDYHIQQWWRVFSERVQDKVERQQLNIMMDDSKPLPSYNYPQTQPPNVKMDEEANSRPTPVTSMDDLLHRRQWEAGNVDYMGKDSFAKIQKRLDDQITKP